MKSIALFSFAALFLAMAFSAQSAHADPLGGGYVTSFPFYTGDYPYYDDANPPAPLYAPFGYYGCRAGCCRQAVWRRGHWHNVSICHR
jgi:hypothetical protein